MELMLLDVSFGFFDIVGMFLTSPVAIVIYVLLGAFLIYKGVKMIRRELAKKNADPAGLSPMIESEEPETEPLPEAAAPSEAAGEENKTE